METVSEFLNRLIQIESHSELFDFKFNFKDFHFWPLVREKVLRKAMNDHFGFLDPWECIRLPKRSYLKFFYLSWKYSALRMPKVKLLIFGSDVTNIKVGNAYFNRVSDHFADVFKTDTIQLERACLNSYKRPRYYKQVYSWDSIALTSLAFNKICRHSKRIVPEVQKFVDYVKENLGYTFQDDYYEKLKLTLSRYEYRLPIIYRAYSTFFKKKRPQLIILEQGCYGIDSAIIIKAAKDLGIRVAEMQHGYIGMDHPAYVFSENIHKDYLSYLPDDFLSYGTYWENNSCLPVSIVNIGNPYLTEYVKNTTQQKYSDLILYISSAINPSKIVQEVLYINDVIKKYGFQLIFRPHPSETHRLANEYLPLFQAGITIDSQNLYESLAKVQFTVSNYGNISTAMYEALAFGCKVIFIDERKDDMIEQRPDCFTYVRNISELPSELVVGSDIMIRCERIWKSDWNNNYICYVSQYLK